MWKRMLGGGGEWMPFSGGVIVNGGAKVGHWAAQK